MTHETKVFLTRIRGKHASVKFLSRLLRDLGLESGKRMLLSLGRRSEYVDNTEKRRNGERN